MPSDIFLSWSTPDEAAIGPLKDKLQDVGLTVWEYSESSQGGGYIPQQVSDAIDDSEVAVVCFSDATADREWIVRETEWVYKAMLAENTRLRAIVPVWVGPHPQNKRPLAVSQAGINTAHLVDPTSTELTHFVETLFGHLRRSAPRVTPAALFAMTEVECQQIQKAALQQLVTLCLAAGMPPGANLQQVFAGRYGPTAEDFAPFVAGTTLVQLTNTLLREANRIRVANRRPPVLLKWMQDEIVGPKKQQEAREDWARSSSLLVIDAASSFHPAIQANLLNLPIPKRPERAALIWLPPFTQHTAAIEQSLQTAATAANIGHVDDAFFEWQKRGSLRAMTFDAFTNTGAALWLRRALLDVEDEDQNEPVAAHVKAMRARSATPFPLGATMAGSSGY
jgi:hypothetical protein